MNDRKLNMTTEQEVLLKILECALKGEAYAGTFPDGINWDKLAQESWDQAVAALTFFSVNQSAIPPEARERWRAMALKEGAHQIWVAQAHADIVALFEKSGIGTVTLKGCASAAYFPRAEYRSLGDVDFFVAPEDHEKGNALLVQNGYRPGSRVGHHDRDYYKNNIHFEMHFAISGVPRGEAGKPFLRQLESLIDDRRMIETNMGEIAVPSDFHHGLIILLHTASHLLSEGIGLRHLCDWAAFADHFTDEEFCALFQEKLESLKIWRFAQVLTKTCERYLGIAPRGWSGDVEERVTARCINEFLTSGDSGRDPEKVKSGMLVSDSFSIRVSNDSSVKQLLSTATGIVEMHWPAAKKCRLLIPFGWLFFGIRYFIRAMLGTRKKLNLVEMSKEADERKKLYKEFGLSSS